MMFCELVESEGFGGIGLAGRVGCDVIVVLRGFVALDRLCTAFLD